MLDFWWICLFSLPRSGLSCFYFITSVSILQKFGREWGIRGGRGQQRLSPPEAVNGGGSSPGVSPENGGSSSMSEGAAWPRIEITLSTQEKEEDFMAFKGTKPSLRPKKRPSPYRRTHHIYIQVSESPLPLYYIVSFSTHQLVHRG
ncbi:hypothetical protein KSP40_PGU014572 [Platanthera guangdongensis]|uniref:Uncharacterized protein n=1 Tax=Platanthera guangdongensis TaxID=2320717 RepID=A0ABR2LI99_9ASPA